MQIIVAAGTINDADDTWKTNSRTQLTCQLQTGKYRYFEATNVEALPLN